MKVVDNTTMMITNSRKRLEHPNDFPSGQDYVKSFPSGNRLQKQSKIFVCCQVELSIQINEFKYGEKSIMHNLIELNTFTKHNKFDTHQKDSIGWFKYINLVIYLQHTTR